METMKVLKELGANFGILLSEKDSIIYPQTLAPELRESAIKENKCIMYRIT